MIYHVKLNANLPRSDIPGYHQWWDVYDDDGRWCHTKSFEPHGEPEQRETFEAMPEPVMFCELSVRADNPYTAIARVKEWQMKGHDKDWLMEEEK